MSFKQEISIAPPCISFEPARHPRMVHQIITVIAAMPDAPGRSIDTLRSLKPALSKASYNTNRHLPLREQGAPTSDGHLGQIALTRVGLYGG